MRFVVEIGKYKNLVLCVNLNEKGEKGSLFLLAKIVGEVVVRRASMSVRYRVPRM